MTPSDPAAPPGLSNLARGAAAPRDTAGHYPRIVTVHELSRLDARRIAVRAQLLDGRRPAGLLDVVRQLTLLQIDPVQDVPFDRTMTAAVQDEIEDLARWLELDLTRPA